MDERKIAEVATALSGLRKHEWTQIKEAIDFHFDRKSAKLQLDGPKELQDLINRHLW